MCPGGSLGIGRYDIEAEKNLEAEEFTSGRVFMGAAPPSATPIVPAATSKRSRDASKSKAGASSVGAGPVLSRATGGPQRAMFSPYAPDALVLQWPKGLPHDAAAASAAGLEDGVVAAADGSRRAAVVVDPHLACVLRPHQREGVRFLWECCMGLREFAGEGAILADAMGLGKTLTTIALVYTMLKQSEGGGAAASKVVICCPSTLVGNWKREFAKWLGNTRCRPASVTATGAAAAETVHNFVHGRSSMYPVLILSYEMCRKYTDKLAGARIGLLVADEGHRLKNASGNQTITALSAVPTRRRVLLTGTPVQNDLLEFYAVCSFVNPTVLGDPGTFRQLFANPIQKGGDKGATPAEQELGRSRATELSRLTSQFVLRRTNELLEKFLPPKTELCVFVRLSPLQGRAYAALLGSSVVRRIMGRGTKAPAATACALQLITALRKVLGHPDLVYPAACADAATAVASRAMPAAAAMAAAAAACPGQDGNAGKRCTSPSRTCVSDAEAHPPTAGAGSIGRGLHPNRKAPVPGGDDLDGAYAALTPVFGDAYAYNVVGGRVASLYPQHAAGAGVTPLSAAQHSTTEAIAASGKLQFLDVFLARMRQECPGEKAVLVSNFTQFLDVVAVLAAARGYPFLRLDGSTGSDKRMKIVNDFNKSPTDGPGGVFLFLLSSKSGGAGLNLIGASRLVMCDADWNPATDRQAEARVWRDGQKRHTFVYRLCTAGTLEEKILQRQMRKGDVAGAVVEEDADVGRKFTKDDLKDLFTDAREPSVDALLDAGEGSCETYRLLGQGAGGRRHDRTGLGAAWPRYTGGQSLHTVDPVLASAVLQLGDLVGVPYVQHSTVNLPADANTPAAPAQGTPGAAASSNTLQRSDAAADAAVTQCITESRGKLEQAAAAAAAAEEAAVAPPSANTGISLQLLSMLTPTDGDLL